MNTNRKTKRCNAPNCNKKIGTLPFPCSACSYDFCVVHRAPESHSCECIEQMQMQKKETLMKELTNNKCSKTSL